jgi:uncharacterized protein
MSVLTERQLEYENVVIHESLLTELLQSKALQRLKHVAMGGITSTLGVLETPSRFKHSVGVMCLVRSLGGSLQEQAAALLHDVSHTAFSHVIDLVFEDTSRGSFHDDRKEDYVHESDIPQICERHGFDWTTLVDERRWSLLDQPAPRLCADRIDYTFRDAMSLKLFSVEAINDLVRHCVVAQDRIAFDELASARQFGMLYLDCDRLYWSSDKQIALYGLTAQVVRRAISLGLVNSSDLWTSDQKLLEILRSTADPEIGQDLRVIEQTAAGLAPHAQDRRVHRRSKRVDPDVVIEGEVIPLSRVDSEWSVLLKAHCEFRT